MAQLPSSCKLQTMYYLFLTDWQECCTHVRYLTIILHIFIYYLVFSPL